MIEVSFYQPKNRPTIMARFTYMGEKIRVTTRLSVAPVHWDKDKSLPKINYKEYRKVKKHLQEFEEKVYKLYESEVSVNELRRQLGLKPKVKNIDFKYILEQLIEDKKNKNISFKSYESLLSTIKKYEKDTSTVLSIYDITPNFKYDFVNWSSGVVTRTKAGKEYYGYSGSSLKRIFGRIKEVRKFAIDEGMIEKGNFFEQEWKIKKFVPDNFTLTPGDIKKTIDAVLDNPTDIVTRDRFLTTYHTGVRISDFNRLEKLEVIEDEGDVFLSFRTLKTGAPVVLPCSDSMISIMKKYSGFPPPVIGQVQNRRLKKLFEKILNYDVEVMENRNMKNVFNTYKAYELITNHTARRSFATNMYLIGVPLSTIQMILGHTKPTQTEEYIKIEQIHKRMSAKELMHILRNSMSRKKE